MDFLDHSCLNLKKISVKKIFLPNTMNWVNKETNLGSLNSIYSWGNNLRVIFSSEANYPSNFLLSFLS